MLSPHPGALIRPALVASAAFFAAALFAAPVLADQVYHSERLPVVSLGAAEGKGQVVNIHANGPVVGAEERYLLVGAEPGSYAVWIQVCASGAYVDFLTTATLETDPRGNGHARGAFSAAALEPFSGATISVRWTFRRDGVDVYATGCTTVTID